MAEQSIRETQLEKLREMIKDIKVAFLTTINGDRDLRSRPMMTQEMGSDGVLWFFTGRDTVKVDELAADPRVCVSYAEPDKNRYVSVTGEAALVQDRGRMEALWSPVMKAWFPEGLDDPNIALLRVTIQKAEYWDSPSGKAVQLFGLIKALATGERADDIGDNEKIDFT